MKNKLITTALVSSMLGAGITASVAQTTVSGNLDLSYMATSAEGNSGSVNSFRGFGKESQINIANKGKLNNGMDYAAGFSLEYDAPDAGTNTGPHEENVYIDIISGNTTLSIGSDHTQSPDANPTVLAGFGYLAVDSTINISGTPTAVAGLYSKGANTPYSAYGVSLTQKTPVGSFSALYVPTAGTNLGGLNDVHNSSTAATAEPTQTRGTPESAYELGFRGDLGVKGLTAMAFYNKQDRMDAVATKNDMKGQRYAATYVTGPFSIAADYAKVEGVPTGQSATIGLAGEDIKSKSIGLGYAITPNLSASITRGESEISNANTVSGRTIAKEEIDMIALGYSLGPVAIQAQYKQADNVAGYSGADVDVFAVKVGTRF
jgi:hypothetical protein